MNYHLFSTDYGPHIYLSRSGAVFRIDEEMAREFAEYAKNGSGSSSQMEARLAEVFPPATRGDHLQIRNPDSDPFMGGVALLLTTGCNLACTYCYAGSGEEEHQAGYGMDPDLASRIVSNLIEKSPPGQVLRISFMGGEPLLNRPAIRAAIQASMEAAKKHISILFSITTNGTLIEEEDVNLWKQYGFAVTVSLDGVGEVHDRYRSFKNGRGSYQEILHKIGPILKDPNISVEARVTVARGNLRLLDTLRELLGLGFDSVGFSPAIYSEGTDGDPALEDFQELGQAMQECADFYFDEILQGNNPGFFNMRKSLELIHTGRGQGYPCSAGYDYFAISPNGTLTPCHRYVHGNPELGNWEALDHRARNQFLHKRHVDETEECGKCWARYLCGGGCYYEVERRGRPSCDFIRNWLDSSLKFYIHILEKSPGYFQAGSRLETADL